MHNYFFVQDYQSPGVLKDDIKMIFVALVFFVLQQKERITTKFFEQNRIY